MEEDATCSLCMEVFKDPVSLPCSHGFCRGCLKSVVGHNSKAKTKENTSSDSAVLLCPLCRTEVTLGARGVDELQPNQDVLDLMSRHSEVLGSAVTVPLCDMCEGEKKTADTYCSTCMTLFCTGCASSLHPRRGPLGRHRMISMTQYLAEESSRPAAVKTGLGRTASRGTDCSEHKEPLSLHCGTCEQPICNRCISQHNNHIMQDVSSDYDTKKAPLEEQVDCCRAMKGELQKLQGDLIATQRDVQTKIEQDYKEIEANYDRCLRSLQDWRSSERDKVDDKRDALTSKSLSLLKTINMLIEESEHLITSSVELLDGNKVVFLLESKELNLRLESHSAKSNRRLEDKRQEMIELRSALSRCDFRPSVVTVPESSDENRTGDKVNMTDAGGLHSQNQGESQESGCSLTGEHLMIEAPKLKFTETTDPGHTYITEEGSAVIIYDRSTSTRTNGLMVAGCQYWEVEVTTQLKELPSDNTGSIGLVGVRQEGSNQRLGTDGMSWSVDIVYNSMNTAHYRCYHGGKICFLSKPMACKTMLPITFGFLLKATERTLTVIDVNNRKRLCIFSDVDVSRPLVPVVATGYLQGRLDCILAMFRLLPVDPTRLPEPVRALLQS